MEKCKCEIDELKFWFPATNENGWKCAVCQNMIGEKGFSPELDREHLSEKIQSLVHHLHELNLVYMSNNSEADFLVEAVRGRCNTEKRFDQYSILLFILESVTQSHSDYWNPLSEQILAGNDPRDRCHCEELATVWQGDSKTCLEHSFEGDKSF